MSAALIFCLLLLSTGAWPRQQSKPQKAVVDVPFHTDGGIGPANSIDQLWNAATIVVSGTLTSGPDYVEIGSSPYTRYRMSVDEVFKGSAELSSVTVQRPGGIVDRGTHLERRINQNFPPFEKGEHYVLFLRQLSGDRYTPPTEEFAFRSNKGVIEPKGRGVLALSLKGRPLADLVASLRTKRGG
jgi:hypothetical protein